MHNVPARMVSSRFQMAHQLAAHAYEHARAAERLCGLGYRTARAIRPLPNNRIEQHFQFGLDATIPGDQLTVGFVLEVDHAIGDYRAALDFIATEIRARMRLNPIQRGAGFPVARDPAQFQKLMDRRFPKLDARFPETRAVLESCQDYRQNSRDVPFVSGPWLGDLDKLWNETKHRALTFHSYRPAQFNLPPEINAQVTERSGEQLHFDLVNRPVFPFLLRCQVGVPDVIGRIPQTVGWTSEEDLDRLLSGIKHGDAER
jgi:hypothetical protein